MGGLVPGTSRSWRPCLPVEPLRCFSRVSRAAVATPPSAAEASGVGEGAERGHFAAARRGGDARGDSEVSTPPPILLFSLPLTLLYPPWAQAGGLLGEQLPSAADLTLDSDSDTTGVVPPLPYLVPYR